MDVLLRGGHRGGKGVAVLTDFLKKKIYIYLYEKFKFQPLQQKKFFKIFLCITNKILNSFSQN